MHHLWGELGIVLGSLERGELDALLAPAPAPARERVQRAEHGLGGAQMLCDVQADASARAGWALLAQRGGKDQDCDKEHQQNEATTADRYEDREVAPEPAPAKSPAAAAAETAAAETSATAAASSQCGRHIR
jgi:hypothetical protein